jgi:acetyl esterase/lipase
MARVYRPRGAPAAPLLGLVDAHGGAWNRLDRTIASITVGAWPRPAWSLPPWIFGRGRTTSIRAASADVAAGVRWMHAHASRLGVDPTRIGLVGQSSGGHLALLVGVRPGVVAHAGVSHRPA